MEDRITELERERVNLKKPGNFEKETTEPAGQEQNATRKVVDSIPVKKDEKIRAVVSSDQSPSVVVSSEQDLESSIAGVVGDHNKFKKLCSLIFSEEELVSGTRTGKRTIKCMDIVKPQLDQVKFQKLE